MGIKPNFTQANVQSRLNKFLEVIEERQIKRLQYLGEMCVTEARDKRTYMVQTGNLLSSTGYTVYKDGVAVTRNFVVIKDGTIGINKGKQLCDSIASKYNSGILLIVVAGENYAIYVESKGYNVLTSAEILAKRELPRMLDELKQNISKALE